MDIALDPQITCIVGHSDKGKSAVLRALRWLMTNRPRGDGMVRIGSDKCTVRLKVDGHTITRHKGKENVYKLDDSEFRAFSTDVPEQIAKVLDIGEINFQGQLDGPFWISKTPGEIAKELNEVVDLDIIDTLLAQINKDTSDAKRRMEDATERQKDAADKAASLEYAEQADAKLRVVEAATKCVQDLHAKTLPLANLIERHAVQAQKEKDCRAICTLGVPILEKGTQWSEIRTRRGKLASTIQKLEQVRVPYVPNLDKVCAVKDRLEAHQERTIALENLLDRYLKQRKIAKDKEHEAQEAQKAYEAGRTEICPLCERPFSSVPDHKSCV